MLMFRIRIDNCFMLDWKQGLNVGFNQIGHKFEFTIRGNKSDNIIIIIFVKIYTTMKFNIIKGDNLFRKRLFVILFHIKTQFDRWHSTKFGIGFDDSHNIGTRDTSVSLLSKINSLENIEETFIILILYVVFSPINSCTYIGPFMDNAFVFWRFD